MMFISKSIFHILISLIIFHQLPPYPKLHNNGRLPKIRKLMLRGSSCTSNNNPTLKSIEVCRHWTTSGSSSVRTVCNLNPAEDTANAILKTDSQGLIKRMKCESIKDSISEFLVRPYSFVAMKEKLIPNTFEHFPNNKIFYCSIKLQDSLFWKQLTIVNKSKDGKQDKMEISLLETPMKNYFDKKNCFRKIFCRSFRYSRMTCHKVSFHPLSEAVIAYSCDKSVKKPLPIYVYLVKADKAKRKFTPTAMHAKYVDDLSILVALNLNDILVPNHDRILPSPFHGRTGHKLDSDRSQVYSQIHEVKEYANMHEMKLNYDKTKFILFNPSTSKDFVPELQVDGEILETVDSVTLVGVEIDSSLSWGKNTKKMVKKAFQRMWVIRRLKRLGASTADLKEVYIKQIRSVLEFAVPVWSPGLTKQCSNEIERVQKVFMHIALGSAYNSYSTALDTLQLERLSTRRLKICKTFARKSANHPRHKDWFQKYVKRECLTTRSKKPKYEVPLWRLERCWGQHRRSWGQQRRCWSQLIPDYLLIDTADFLDLEESYLDKQVSSEKTIQINFSLILKYGEIRTGGSSPIHGSGNVQFANQRYFPILNYYVQLFKPLEKCLQGLLRTPFGMDSHINQAFYPDAHQNSMADALKKNTRSQMCWASAEKHSKYFSLVKAIRKSPTAGTLSVGILIPNIIGVSPKGAGGASAPPGGRHEV